MQVRLVKRTYMSFHTLLTSPEFTRCSPPAVANFHKLDSSTLAERWITECRHNHKECTSTKSDFRPKRLVQIINENHWKLVFARTLPRGDGIDYVALSHCWGGSTQLLKLTENNECQFQDRMQVDILPTTFKEAISTCMELKYQYLWIDSLCITQDSPEDWQEQAAEMGSVYENAALNLCMAGSRNPSEPSFVSRNTDLILPLSITLANFWGAATTFHIICDGIYDIDIKNTPLRDRGWVFQEWYLAKRSLIFGRMQLWWQCCERLACETIPTGISGTELDSSDIVEAAAMKRKAIYGSNDLSPSLQHWWDLVTQYASTKLTEETKDRIIAFSGIATAFGERFNMDYQYLAGMWRSHLPRALLWSQCSASETYRSLEGYKAPSWSWMSLDGPVSLRGSWPVISKGSHYCSLERVDLSLVDERNMTGQLEGGSIHVHGHLLRLQKGSDARDINVELVLRHFDHDRGGSQILWDERDDNGFAVVSHFEKPVTEPCHGGLQREFSRTRTSLRHANGSIFALPISSYGGEELGRTCAVGLVLYQPLHQLDVFHRVGLYDIDDSLDFTVSFQDRLKSQYPARSICIV